MFENTLGPSTPYDRKHVIDLGHEVLDTLVTATSYVGSVPSLQAVSHQKYGGNEAVIGLARSEARHRRREFFIHGAPWLEAGLLAPGVVFQDNTFGQRNPVERVIQEIK
jgi:hypothetical protein